MSISVVAKRIGIDLDPLTRQFVNARLTVRRQEMWTQGCSWSLEDEYIESLLVDIFRKASTAA